MSEPIITVEGLGKRYRLGTGRSNERYTALRDVLTDKARFLFRRNNSQPSTLPPLPGTGYAVASNSQPSPDFWALKDVSFEVKQGEVVGIIGRNGAGKSTLLKILSRITEPTEGRVRIKGRVASLLEVGTGFHPELTGRENIFLNGAILGMHRHEIKAKFDEIIAFAEIEKFLDTPVKRYSSGMYVRLAFAVAAHLDPEILIVDEVLAVGDAEFQKKCLGKMRHIAEGGGRTVLFVSHNMAAVRNLCGRAMHLVSGQAVAFGATDQVVAEYLDTSRTKRVSTLDEVKRRIGKGTARCLSVSVAILDNGESGAAGGVSVSIDVTYEAFVYVRAAKFSIDIDSPDGFRVTTLYSGFLGQSIDLPEGRGTLRCRVDQLSLTPDTYSISVMFADEGEWLDYAKDVAELTVPVTDVFGTGNVPNRSQGPLISRYRWSRLPENSDAGDHFGGIASCD